MKLPFNFKEFVKNPFAAIALLCILGMGYLYMETRSIEDRILGECKETTISLRKDIETEKNARIKWQNKFEDLLDKLAKQKLEQ